LLFPATLLIGELLLLLFTRPTLTGLIFLIHCYTCEFQPNADAMPRLQMKRLNKRWVPWISTGGNPAPVRHAVRGSNATVLTDQFELPGDTLVRSTTTGIDFAAGVLLSSA